MNSAGWGMWQWTAWLVGLVFVATLVGIVTTRIVLAIEEAWAAYKWRKQEPERLAQRAAIREKLLAAKRGEQ